MFSVCVLYRKLRDRPKHHLICSHPVLFRQVSIYKLQKLSSVPRRAAVPHVDSLNPIVLMSKGWKVSKMYKITDKFTADMCCHSWER